MTTSTLYFTVPDMDCGGCVKSITAAIHQHDATAEIDADLDSKVVSINGNEDANAYRSAIEEAGFTVSAP